MDQDSPQPEAPKPASSRRVPKLKPKEFLILLVVAIIVVAVASSFYLFDQYKKTKAELTKLKANPSEASQQEAKSLIEKVGKLVNLPEGEQPTVATITDIERLKDQAFFAKAKNGDRVLIYTQARKAYLYDPIADKLIDVAPVNIGTPSATPRR